MKKLIMALSVLLIAGLSKASANSPVNINSQVKSAFNAEFNLAKNVSWSETAYYVVAQFDLNNQVLFAYYKPDGSFIGIIHHLLTTDLPAGLKKGLKKKYDGYWVSELFKMDNDQGTTYYVKLENASEVVMLSSDEFDGWNTFKVTDKSGKQSASL